MTKQMKTLKTAYNDLLWHGAVAEAARKAGVDVSIHNSVYVEFCRQRNALVPGQKFAV